MTYHIFTGIDISKKDFYVAFQGCHKSFTYENSEPGWNVFYNDHKALLEDSLVVLESTGGYEYGLLSYLCGLNIKVHRADTRKVKSFIRSYGKAAKTDRLDALALAHYGAERYKSLALFKPLETFQTELKLLEERRRDLIQILVQEKNRLKAPGNAFLKLHIQKMIASLEIQLKEIEALLRQRIDSDVSYRLKKEELMTIPGIGEKTAHTLLALVPELGTTDRRHIASLMGLAPHMKQSGQKTWYARTSGGRRSMRPILFLAAMAARRSHSSFRTFYETLIQRGKKPLVALVALMRKLIVVANAKLRDLRLPLEAPLPV